MKKIIIAGMLAGTTLFACKKAATITDPPAKYYFKIEPVDDDDVVRSEMPYKQITVK